MYKFDNTVNVALIGVLIIVGLLILYYVVQYKSEGICGGYDQCCPCSGNETLTVRKDVTSNDLSKVAMGYNV